MTGAAKDGCLTSEWASQSQTASHRECGNKHTDLEHGAAGGDANVVAAVRYRHCGNGKHVTEAGGLH
jgi:hypothetical protein